MLDMTSNLDKIIKIFKMTGCAVLGCRSNNNKKLRRNKGTAGNKSKINFHRFPKNKQLCDIWLKQSGRKCNFNITHAKVCSEHFLADCYERNLQHELLSITPKCRKLKPDAIPTERLPNMARSNYLGKRICHRRNATETNTYEDENSQPEQNQINSRQLMLKEEMKSNNRPILPKPIAKPMKFVFVNAGPPQPPMESTITASTITQQIITTSDINDHSEILRSTLMLPPGTTIKHIPTPITSTQETPNIILPKVDTKHMNKDEESKSLPPQTPAPPAQSRSLYHKITKHKKNNLAINKERLEIEKSRQQLHELIADKIFAILNCRSNNGHNENLSYCNIKQEI